ncbi:glycosyltransferase [Streptomyces capparidis]
MSVHSHSTAQPQRPTGVPEFPRHIVTAVLVAHDGARWLPDVLSGLTGQERPVQDVVAADTGSADASAELLKDALGDQRVLHLGRRTGFGAAVDEAVRTVPPVDPSALPYLGRTSGGWDPATRTWHDDEPDAPPGEPVQWLWLLHDDSAPEPDALAQLLRVADSSPSTAVVGPKLRSWYDRRTLLEAGVSIARSGRRWTGLDRREQDQGQHDQVRQVLAVSSAGMLVRRDVWERLGGFDGALPLMRDDVDFCWRAQAAGHTVMVAPGAVLRHAEAAARERRPIDCARQPRPHRVDKAGAVYTLLANTRGALLPYVLLRVVVGTLLRTLGYLIGKVPGQALDEIAGLASVLLRPGRVLSARRARSGARGHAAELRPLFPPPGATIRLAVEQLAANVGGRAADGEASAGRHGAVDTGPTDEDADFLEVENFARLKRIARKPAPVLFAALLVVSLLAARGLLTGGALSGGALLPPPEGASDLWARLADAWHPVGTGSTEPAPPYLGFLAVLGTVLLGDAGLAVGTALVASVPLAGLTAYLAARPLVASRMLRAWGSVTYALLPAVTGALAAGRLGTAVLAVLLPLIARAAASAAGLNLGRAALDRGARPNWRGAWATALLLTVVTAFTPVVWPAAAVLCVLALAARAAGAHRRLLAPLALRFAVALGTPLALLAPWSLGLLTDPSRFLVEAGLPFVHGDAAPAADLALLSPGGPGVPPAAVLVGVLLAGLGALLRAERRTAILAAWAAALTGLAFALPTNGAEVTGDGMADGQTWAGPAVLLYSLGLLTAAVVGAEGIRTRVAGTSFGWRQPAAALVAVAAALAPLCAAGAWLMRGAGDPLDRRDPVQVPAFVAAESATRDQARTLVIGGDSRADVSYTLVRGSGVRLGDAEAAALRGGDRGLARVVSDLLAGTGADQADRLAEYAVRFVLVEDGPAQRELAGVLDTTPGVLRLSQENGAALWRVDRTVARVTITGGGLDRPVAVAAGPVGARDTVPDGGEGRVLRLAESADGNWRATLDGRALKPVTVDGWAQGFELPASGGRLTLTYETPFAHTAWLWTQGFLLLVVLVLALPGRRRDVDDDLPEVAAAVPAQAPDGEGRRARRLRAQAAEAERAGAEPEPEYAAPEYAGPEYAGPGAGAAGPPPEPAEPPVLATVPVPDHEDEGSEWNAFQPAARPAEPRPADPYAHQYRPDGADPYAAPGYGDYQGGSWPPGTPYQEPYGYQQGGYQQGGYPPGTGDADGYGAADPYPGNHEAGQYDSTEYDGTHYDGTQYDASQYEDGRYHYGDDQYGDDQYGDDQYGDDQYGGRERRDGSEQ